MAEAPSVTTFVVGDKLPWTDDAASDENGPFDPGVVYESGARQECSIRKISARGVTLQGGDLGKTPGDHISVELGTGQRPAGTIAWAKHGEVGVCFDEPVDMVALLNRKLVSQPVERRLMPRVEIRSDAYVKFGEKLAPATLRNISAKGLQLEGAELPPCGTYVAVFVEGLNVPPGEVIWRRGDLAGIEVFEELSWTSIIPWIRSAIRKGSEESVSQR